MFFFISCSSTEPHWSKDMEKIKIGSSKHDVFSEVFYYLKSANGRDYYNILLKLKDGPLEIYELSDSGFLLRLAFQGDSLNSVYTDYLATEVQVNAYLITPPPKKTFEFIIHKKTDSDYFLFKEIEKYLVKIIETKGYTQSKSPDIYIHVSFDLSAPLNIGSASQSNGVAFDYSSLYSSPLAAISISTQDTKHTNIFHYTKTLNLVASSSKDPDKSDSYLWKTLAKVTDGNNNIRSISPVLIFAISALIEKSQEASMLVSPYNSDFRDFFQKM